MICSVHYDGVCTQLASPVGDHITKTLLTGVFYEKDLLAAIHKLDLPGIYLDVGAHVGNHAAFFAVHCPASRVIAFEPNPEILPYLRANAGIGFDVRGVAVHDQWKRALVDDATPGNHGMAHVVSAPDVLIHDEGVPCAGIDDFDFQDVAVIKIDVERCELPVLRSARKTLERDRPVIAAEAQTDELRDEIDEFLSPFGYARVPTRYCATPTYLWV